VSGSLRSGPKVQAITARVPSAIIVGAISEYMNKRYGFSSDCKVAAFTGGIYCLLMTDRPQGKLTYACPSLTPYLHGKENQSKKVPIDLAQCFLIREVITDFFNAPVYDLFMTIQYYSLLSHEPFCCAAASSSFCIVIIILSVAFLR
jgi:hypothetical protein